MSVAALVLGIIALALGALGSALASFACGPLAIAFGAVAVRRRRGSGHSRVMAWWGVGLGAAGLAFWIVLLAVVAATLP